MIIYFNKKKEKKIVLKMIIFLNIRLYRNMKVE